MKDRRAIDELRRTAPGRGEGVHDAAASRLGSVGCVLPEVGGDAVLWVTPDADSELGAALDQVHRDKILRRELIDRGNEQWRGFTWKRTVSSTIEVYREVVEERS